MTRPRDSSTSSAAPDEQDSRRGHPRNRRPARTIAPIIDGVAEVTARRPLQKSAAARSAARRERHVEETVWADGEAEARSRGFGRRTESFFADTGPFGRTARHRTAPVPRRREDDSDLLWQALDLSRHARLKPAAEPVGLQAALPRIQRSIGSKARNAALVAGGFLVGLLAIPVFLLSSSAAPVAAPIPGIAVMGDRSDLVLERVTASLLPRGEGKVLSVEGTVRNVAARNAIVPPLRIALSDAGSIVGERPLSIGVRHLTTGQSVHFVSRIAVPSATTGRIAIGFRSNRAASGSVR